MKTTSLRTFFSILILALAGISLHAAVTGPTNAGLAVMIPIGESHDTGALNVVITGDGFQDTAADKQLLVDRATRWYAAMVHDGFLANYKAMVNFWVLWIPSVDSGVTITGTLNSAGGYYDNVVKNTAYSMSYDQAGSLIVGNYFTAWLDANYPWRDVTVYVTKSAGPVKEGFVYAWGEFNNRRMVFSLESETSSNEYRFIKTLAGSLAGLASESNRWSGLVTADDLNAPNISSTSTPADKTTLKWGEWITGAVQLDTYQTINGITSVDFVEGGINSYDMITHPLPILGSFDLNHVYWPVTQTVPVITTVKPYRFSLMSLNPIYNFWYLNIGVVHTEAFIRSIYRLSDAIASNSPADTTAAILTKTDVSITPRAISTLKVRWYIDSVEQVGSVANTFTIDPATLAAGTHKLKAQVYDLTTQVRASYLADLVSSREWTVGQVVVVIPPVVTPPATTPASGGGGGGGAMSDWFLAALVAMTLTRKVLRSRKAA